MKLALAVLAIGLFAGSATADFVGGTFESGALTVVEGSDAMGSYSTGLWYTPGTAGWNQCWHQLAHNVVYGDQNAYNMALEQFIANPGPGTYTLSFQYTSAAQLPNWGSGWGIGTKGYADTMEMKNYDPFVREDPENPGTNIPNGTVLASGGFTAGMSSWTTVSVPITIASTDPFLLVYFRADGNDGWNTRPIQIDNVSLTPEPATLAVLGMGALGLLRRRRA